MFNYVSSQGRVTYIHIRTVNSNKIMLLAIQRRSSCPATATNASRMSVQHIVGPYVSAGLLINNSPLLLLRTLFNFVFKLLLSGSLSLEFPGVWKNVERKYCF